jgi:hypothetical protein
MVQLLARLINRWGKRWNIWRTSGSGCSDNEQG